jgi:hypothetical protein
MEWSSNLFFWMKIPEFSSNLFFWMKIPEFSSNLVCALCIGLTKLTLSQLTFKLSQISRQHACSINQNFLLKHWIRICRKKETKQQGDCCKVTYKWNGYGLHVHTKTGRKAQRLADEGKGCVLQAQDAFTVSYCSPTSLSKLLLDDNTGICIQFVFRENILFTLRKNPKESMTVSIDGMDNFKYRFPRKVLPIVIRKFFLILRTWLYYSYRWIPGCTRWAT